ncbi:MAG TPA: antibiotic biosynthesis monooxygenase [Anaerolineae bacterium]|nr:antibiotic biosynthesis monooxygenase [Anaerolineae bacterium]HMR68169.1 antibiotic biosynthesis monooxygenase [Anaerolineae bacterium]
MYGTIAKVQVNPKKIEELQALSQQLGLAPGQIARYVYRMDADPNQLYLVAVFESREAYQANATSPEQHQRYLELRALLDADPEWHDGEIIDTLLSKRPVDYP